jgi:hypothetical protein
MKNWMKLVMAAVMASMVSPGFQARATEREIVAVDLNDYAVGTILLSDTRHRALVQIINEKRGLTNFAICRAIVPFKTIFESFTDCQVNRYNWFANNEDSRSRLSLLFSNELDANFKKAREMENDAPAVSAAVTTFVGSVFTLFSMAEFYMAGSPRPQGFDVDPRLRTLIRVFGLGTLGAAVGAFYIAATYREHAKALATKPMSIEEATAKNLERLSSQERESIIHMSEEEKNEASLLTFDLIRRSLMTALDQMNMA